MRKIFSHAPSQKSINKYTYKRMNRGKKTYEIIKMNSYMPLTHEGSFTSSTQNRAFNSGVDTSFKRGAEGADIYFFTTGYTICNDQRSRNDSLRAKESNDKEKRSEGGGWLRRGKKRKATCKCIFWICLQGHPCTILLMSMPNRGTANFTSSGYAKIQRHNKPEI